MTELQTQALELAKGLEPTASNIERVAARTSSSASTWAFTQWQLRSSAARKFANAAEMLFTRDALEMASHEAVARYHGSQFPNGELVADLTAGIGSDLIALASRGVAKGFEIVTECAEYARHNLETSSLNAEIINASSLVAEWEFDFAFADPSRRKASRRIFQLDEYEPSPYTLAEHMKRLKLAGIKLSPMLQDTELLSLGSSIEFISHDWECKEAIVWLGRQSAQGTWAVQVENDERLMPSSQHSLSAEHPYPFFYESDPAAIRAHCLSALCKKYDMALLGDSNGYLTSKRIVKSSWLRPYSVVDHGTLAAKRVRDALKAHGLSALDIKHRNTTKDMSKEKKMWRIDGGANAWVAIYPVKRSLKYAILVPAAD